VLEVNEKSIRIVHEMTHDETGDVAATTVIVGVYIDATTRRARPLPSDVRELATLMVRNTGDGVDRDDAGPLLELTRSTGCRPDSSGPLV
jgi:hypothetical protein